MPIPTPPKVKSSILLTPEAHWRLNLHAIIEEKTASEIVVELIRNHLPNYKVSIAKPNDTGPMIPETLKNGRKASIFSESEEA
jgi:hypothetical protein